MTARETYQQMTRVFLASALLALGGCVTVQDGPPKEKRDISQIPDAVPRVHNGELKDSPYTLNGITYTPMPSANGYEEVGVASWYGTKFHGKRTANGEVYDLYGMTAAHKTLPLPSYVRVMNRDNGRSVVLRVNDRGPFHSNRVIDLSYAAAKRLGFANVGVANVKVEGIDVEAFAARQEQEARSKQQLFVQMAALKNYHNAQMLRRAISETIAGEIQVMKGDEKPDPLYRIRIGPVQTPEHLESLLEKLEEGAFDAPFLVYEDRKVPKKAVQ
ncbi:septal ring lytic transglycosylase RlpA family lipoprotein [Endozoicomonas sp. OPT23]|uniref:septal ring lytic transglycosylase RlpA family protein n=1 Tax=Endozoicomonas sp. OPT23 TaxID=2072845 RepID=UPI00129AF9C3|nr:septal ring lytic transglycosylase RlpA family protein [Endozoicomonas sp. OPT23]MRI33578.1 septal ring lytic transglycosylase RlpA family lipoprotein [Endozoicomonas sp. OPT23]